MKWLFYPALPVHTCQKFKIVWLSTLCIFIILSKFINKYTFSYIYKSVSYSFDRLRRKYMLRPRHHRSNSNPLFVPCLGVVVLETNDKFALINFTFHQLNECFILKFKPNIRHRLLLLSVFPCSRRIGVWKQFLVLSEFSILGCWTQIDTSESYSTTHHICCPIIPICISFNCC